MKIEQKIKRKVLERKLERKPLLRWQVALVILLFIFLANNPIYAQLLCETEPATTDGNIQNSNRLLDAIIIGISIVIVLFTLVMSLKYLFKPGENGQDHIKNIVKDEGF